MTQVSVHEAKTHLSRLLSDVERGEVIIARNGEPVARQAIMEGATVITVHRAFSLYGVEVLGA